MRLRLLIMSLCAATATAALAASPASEVRTRIAGYRALGSAFKTANDTVRRRDVANPRLRKAAAQIVSAARQQYRWYPATSRPAPGLKTAAKAEIWSRPDDFRKLQDGFLAQAQRFQTAIASGDAGAIRSEARKLGARCKSCHDQFRLADD